VCIYAYVHACVCVYVYRMLADAHIAQKAFAIRKMRPKIDAPEILNQNI